MLRDRLSHRYHRVDPGQLWTMASVDVPAVAEKLRSIEFEG
ncbi:MAG: HepT-like ribonuclease domain-containing protein [Ilumatobacteraceae bacterium]